RAGGGRPARRRRHRRCARIPAARRRARARADTPARYGAHARVSRPGAARRLRAARARRAEGARDDRRAGLRRRPHGAARGEHAERAREGGPPLMGALREWWLGLARRERIGAAAAAAFALAAALYLLALEPAWRTRERLAKELPLLRAQAAQVEALRLEARGLKERAVRFDNAAELGGAASNGP